MDLGAYSDDPCLRAFRGRQMILEDGTRYAEAAEDWQEERLFLPLHDPTLTRLWMQRERGASKTSTLAWFALECLLFKPEPYRIVVVAADQDQAGLLRDALWGFVVRNPALQELVNVERHRVTAGENVLTILSSDAASSTGLNADLYVFEELAQWDGDTRRRFFENVWSGIGKRKGQRAVVVTNAGFSSDWRKSLRDLFKRKGRKTKGAWYYYAPPRPPLPSWIDPDERAAQAEALPPHVASRLYGNVWTSGTGSAFAHRDIARLFTLSGPAWYAGTLDRNTAQVHAGLDIGLRHDAAALVVVALTPEGLKLLSLHRWMPDAEADVPLVEVEEAVAALVQSWPTARVLTDPWQAAGLVQKLKARGVNIDECAQSGPQLHKQAATLLGLVRAGQLQLFGDPMLRQDLGDAEIVEKAYGFRLQSPRTRAGGHGDLLSALQLACYSASQETARIDPPEDKPTVSLSEGGLSLFNDDPSDDDADLGGELRWKRFGGLAEDDDEGGWREIGT